MERFTYKMGYTQNGADRPWYTIYDKGERITEVNKEEEAHSLCVLMNQLNDFADGWREYAKEIENEKV